MVFQCYTKGTLAKREALFYLLCIKLFAELEFWFTLELRARLVP